MLIYVAITLLGGLAFSAGLVAGPTRARRLASVLFAISSLSTPFLVPRSHSFLRCIVALGAALALMRAIDLARDKTAYPLHVRVGLMFSLFDLRAARPIAPRIELKNLAIGVAYAVAGVTACAIALRVPAPLRWILGAAGVYCLADAGAQLMLFVTESLGSAIPKQHDRPILSRSVREFWSTRWNLNVRDWLFRHCHRPLARRGRPTLGIMFAFLASTLVHFWMVVVPLGWRWAAVMASFFVIQGALFLFESRLAVSEWPTGLQRAWAVLAVLGPSPLFVEPTLRIIG